MRRLMPEPKEINFSGSVIKNVKGLRFDLSEVTYKSYASELRTVIEAKMWNFNDPDVNVGTLSGTELGNSIVTLEVHDDLSERTLDNVKTGSFIYHDLERGGQDRVYLLDRMGYVINADGRRNKIDFNDIRMVCRIRAVRV
jgi:hypothetical protein